MKLQINVPVSGLDLANLLQGEEGFFLCQIRMLYCPIEW